MLIFTTKLSAYLRDLKWFPPLACFCVVVILGGVSGETLTLKSTIPEKIKRGRGRWHTSTSSSAAEGRPTPNSGQRAETASPHGNVE